MSVEEAVFLAAVLADPNDDTPRLVYADWLQDHAVDETCGHCDAGRVYGRDPRSPRRADAWHSCLKCGGTGRVTDGRGTRAEFIRVQCELARLSELQRSGAATREDAERQNALLQREAQLTLAVYPRTVWPVKDWLQERGIDPDASAFNRGGWLTEVVCPAVAWLAHGDTIASAQPVTAVRLTAWPLIVWSAPTEWLEGFATIGDPAVGHVTESECRVATGLHLRTVFDVTAPISDLRRPYELILRCRWPRITFTLSG